MTSELHELGQLLGRHVVRRPPPCVVHSGRRRYTARLPSAPFAEITSDTHAAKRDVKASKDEPQYLVKSDKSGGEAVHKPDALKKKK